MSKARASPGFVVFWASSRPALRLAGLPGGYGLVARERHCCRPPGMSAVPHAKKKPVHAYELFLKYGGEGGIDSLRSPLRGSPLAGSPVCPNWLRQLSNPRSGVLIPPAENIKEKSPYLAYRLSILEYGGEGGDSNPPIRCRIHTFPGVLLQPLRNTSPYWTCCSTLGGQRGATIGSCR
ncbi:Uncharacterised protein [Klebsiella pneumoniae]|uniref:Uncharacterized protein n=1 Tax=Klebsiella pneumoniae TaxID=573 RepID=A0A2X3H5A9_KLEPN|nr:Uncharacterised protein [Klebsiella pneumoniae]